MSEVASMCRRAALAGQIRPRGLLNEAADEIDKLGAEVKRLRAALRKVRNKAHSVYPDKPKQEIYSIVRMALGE